ncbi:MAG TPA: hypothetical protein VNZ01_15105 [Solirubrobacteraceae bacterium]|nr:hypothetical protein [Solirubrobacteraceae bacterium]
MIFTDEGLEWLSSGELRPFLAVSQALYARLEEPENTEQFRPYAEPTPERIVEVREAIRSNELRLYSSEEAQGRNDISPEDRKVGDALLYGVEPLGDVLADEWYFVTTESLAVLKQKARATIEAFKRAGAKVYEISDRTMGRALEKVQDAIPGPVLAKLKGVARVVDRRPSKVLLLGGAIAALIVPHIGIPVAAAEIAAGATVLIAGDP